VSFRNRALFLESKGGGKDLPKTPLGSWADRGTDRNRRASSHRSHLALIPLAKLFPGRTDIIIYKHPTVDPPEVSSYPQCRPGPDDPHW